MVSGYAKTWETVTYPIIIGHAGNTVANPPNTIPAFDYAICGCEGIECDVCLTIDQIPVIIHGPLMESSTDTVGVIAEMEYSEVCNANASAKFKDGTFPSTFVPSALELLDRYNGKCLIELDIKDKNVAPIIANMIKERNMQEYVLIFTVDESVMIAVKEIDPTIKTLYAPVSSDVIPTISRLLELRCFGVSVYKSWLTEQYIIDAHAAGIKVQVSWLDTIAEVDYYTNWNVDIILSGDPIRHKLHLKGGINLPDNTISISSTTSDLTMYVSPTGNDSNNGLSSSTALLTISKAISLLPLVINHKVTINVSIGIYNELVSVSGFVGKGSILLLGGATLAETINYKINNYEAINNVPRVHIAGFKAMSTTSMGILFENCSHGSSYYNDVSEVALGFPAACFRRTFGYISACNLGNHSAGLESNLSNVCSNNNTGSGNTSGLYASYGGIIAKAGTQPGGTTAESQYNGGFIHS